MDTDLDQINSSLDPSHLQSNAMSDDLLLSHGLDADDLASFLSATCESVPHYAGSFTATEPSLTPSSEQGLVVDPDNDDKNPQQCVCPECGKIFNSVWYLKQHAVKHSNDRPFRCKFCGKTYKFRSNLYQHKCPERQRVQGPRMQRRRKLPRPTAVVDSHRQMHGDSPVCSSGASASSASPGVIAQKQTEAAYAMHKESMNPLNGLKPSNVSPNHPIAAFAPEYGTVQPLCSPNGYQANMTVLSAPVTDPVHPVPPAVHYLQPMQPNTKVYAPPPYSYRPSVSEDYAQQYIEQHKQHLHVCRRCKPMQYFPSREYLSRHISWHAERERRMQCSACAELLPTERDFQEHSKTHQIHSPHKCSSCSGTFKSPIWLRRHYASSARCDGAMPPNEHELLSLNAPKDPYAFIHQPAIQETEGAQGCPGNVSPLNMHMNTHAQEDEHSSDKLRTAVGHALAGLDSGLGSSCGGDVDSSPGTGGSVADSLELGYNHTTHGSCHSNNNHMPNNGCAYIPVANYSSMRAMGNKPISGLTSQGQAGAVFSSNMGWGMGQPSLGVHHPSVGFAPMNYSAVMMGPPATHSSYANVQWLQPHSEQTRPVEDGTALAYTQQKQSLIYTHSTSHDAALLMEQQPQVQTGVLCDTSSRPHQYHLAGNKFLGHPSSAKVQKLPNMITLETTLTPPPDTEEKQHSTIGSAISQVQATYTGCGSMTHTPPSSPNRTRALIGRAQSAPPVLQSAPVITWPQYETRQRHLSH